MNTISVFLLLLYGPWATEAKINVEGFEGGEVTFQCAHKFARRNQKYLCRNVCNTNEDVLVTVKYGETAQSGRITLVDLKDGAFTVNISRLQLSDSGKYKCAVSRPGFDTFTDVNLTVKKDAKETPAFPPDASPTWTYQNISKTTQQIFEMDTNESANVSATPNCTSRGGDRRTSAALYVTMAAMSMLTILVLATTFRKCRDILKPQPQVCSNSRDLVDAVERQQVDCNNTEAKVMRKPSERTFCPQHRNLNPPSSESAAAGSLDFPVYENMASSSGPDHSSHSAANVQNDQDLDFRIYINPLPTLALEGTDNGSAGKHATTLTGNEQEENCTTNGSDARSASRRSLWFGLDSSGAF
ncbi:hypothetical protein Q5P01_026332 [Channa striata]|uniref:Immunoglobulin domain-containing protein n=1 Tax=Channa striata TaxID=64152 RepID=A0AA88LH01_CHASR|nr:hypothetical protein Q5P01_026332 [Channa striata]